MALNTFDAMGQKLLTTITDTNGAVLATNGFGYEPGGLATNEVNALGGVTARACTSTGKPKWQINPDGSTNGWTYYLDGRLHREYRRNGAYGETTYEDA